MTAHKWLAPEDKYLRKYYPACGAKIVADALGITPKQVIDYAHKIGVKTRHRGGKPFQPGADARRKIPQGFVK